MFKRVPAILERHVQIQQHKVELRGFGKLQGLDAVGRRNGGIAFPGQQPHQHLPDGGIIIHQQYLSPGWWEVAAGGIDRLRISDGNHN